MAATQQPAGAGAAGAAADSDVHVQVVQDGARSIRLRVSSWNVGNKPPAEDLSPWIPTAAEAEAYDVIAVGVQEGRYSAPGETPASTPSTTRSLPGEEEAADDPGATPSPSKRTRSTSRGSVGRGAFMSSHLGDMIRDQLGDRWVSVAVETLMEMRLWIFVRDDHCEGVTGPALISHLGIETKTEATGLVGVVGNKGGLLIKLSLYGTQLCFVSCHLAAHQDQQFLLQRNADCQEIIDGTRAACKAAALQQFDHVFWFGDLNYRIDLNSADEGSREHAEHVEEVIELVQREDWATLQAADQLSREIREGRCLQGFQDAGPLDFAPTFKVMRTEGTEYKAQRVPSWCDRILHRSLPDKECNLTPTMYRGVPELTTSDHKPVMADFDIALAPPVTMLKSFTGSSPVITLTNLRCEGLQPMDLNGLADPYIVFHAAPPGLFGTMRKQTERINKTLSPSWTKAYTLRPCVASPAELARCHLVMAVVDYDFGNPDDPMGSGVLSLHEAASNMGEHVPFELTLLHLGVAAGTLSGEVMVSRHHLEHAHSVQSVNGGCCVVQ